MPLVLKLYVLRSTWRTLKTHFSGPHPRVSDWAGLNQNFLLHFLLVSGWCWCHWFRDHTFRTSGLCCPRAFFMFRKGCGSHPSLTWSSQQFDPLNLATLWAISVFTSQLRHQQPDWSSCRDSTPETCIYLPSTQWNKKTRPADSAPDPSHTEVARQHQADKISTLGPDKWHQLGLIKSPSSTRRMSQTKTVLQGSKN